MKMEDYDIIDYNWIVECEFGEKTQAYRDGKKFYVNWEDYDKYVKGNSFYLSKPERGCGGYVESRVNGRIIGLHRLIMEVDNDMVVDHINHNTLDNTRNNLRVCTQRQNLMNMSKRKDNKSGMTGVSWHSQNKNWNVRLKTDGIYKSIGCFKNFEEACKARKEAEIKYFGEYRNKDNE